MKIRFFVFILLLVVAPKTVCRIPENTPKEIKSRYQNTPWLCEPITREAFFEGQEKFKEFLQYRKRDCGHTGKWYSGALIYAGSSCLCPMDLRRKERLKKFAPFCPLVNSLFKASNFDELVAGFVTNKQEIPENKDAIAKEKENVGFVGKLLQEFDQEQQTLEPNTGSARDDLFVQIMQKHYAKCLQLAQEDKVHNLPKLLQEGEVDQERYQTCSLGALKAMHLYNRFDKKAEKNAQAKASDQ